MTDHVESLRGVFAELDAARARIAELEAELARERLKFLGPLGEHLPEEMQ